MPSYEKKMFLLHNTIRYYIRQFLLVFILNTQVWIMDPHCRVKLVAKFFLWWTTLLQNPRSTIACEALSILSGDTFFRSAYGHLVTEIKALI